GKGQPDDEGCRDHIYDATSNYDSEERSQKATIQRSRFQRPKKTLSLPASEIHHIPQGLKIPLSDGISPSYDSWEHLVRANLRTYSHCFLDSRAIMDHIFAQTTGKAMDHLIQRLKPAHPQAFTSEDEMFEWLEGIFRDPNERETARVAYNRCRMSTTEPFNSFYSRFSSLATKAQIGQSDQLQDMYRKLHPDLHQLAINFMASSPKYDMALKHFHYLDNELRINTESRNRRQYLLANRLSTAKLPNSAKNLPVTLTKHEDSYGPESRTYNYKGTPHAPTFQLPNNRKCYYCHKTGHLSRECSDPPNPNRATNNLHQIDGNITGADASVLQTVNEEGEEFYEDSENEEP
ncbi:hypothetical protein K3495_g13904, partial [Podosphaera aphanis]